MNIIESLDFAIEVSESGRPGAAVQILKSITAALRDGRDSRGDFFPPTSSKDQLASLAQSMAFAEEAKRKVIQKASVQDDLQDDLSGDVA